MPEPSTPSYGAVLARNAGMRARDGTWLATDVWRPASGGEPLEGPFPAIVVRTPYSRTTERVFAAAEFWACHGYVAVYQDVRGRFGSEGDFRLLADEGPDGYDAIEWVAALPYCDGNVGTTGTSYLAWVQNALAVERPPHLRAMWVNQGGSNGNVTSLRHNGALELRWLTWAVSHGIRSPEAARSPELARRLTANAESMFEWLTRLPWGDADDPEANPLAGLPGYAAWARDLHEHGDADAFWQSSGLDFSAHYDESADVPTVYSGGWYDSYTRATTDNYVAFAARLAHQRLLVGPWTHGDRALERQWSGEVDLGPSAPIGGNLAPSRLHLQLRWFDHWLKGVDNGVEREPPVKVFVMGGGTGERTPEGRLLHGGGWRELEGWPPPGSTSHRLFLHPGGRLAADAPGDAGGSSVFEFDPEHPLPTISANTSSLNEIVPAPERLDVDHPLVLVRVMVTQGGADQRTHNRVLGAEPPFGPLEQRPDVLAFSTGVLEEDIEVVGSVEAVVHLSSDAPDTDLFVMVEDVYPPGPDWPEGFRLNITDGLMRVRYREAMDRPRMMTPGDVVRVTVPLYPTANRFVAGHRLQLLISSSSFPRFDVNPNTGEPIGRHTHSRVAVNTVHHSADHPSHLTLTVAPAVSGLQPGAVR